MRARHLLLGLGAITLLASAVLGVIWFRLPHQPALPNLAGIDRPQVLSAARAIKERSLLRRDDLTWKPVAQVPAGAYTRGSSNPADFTGAVTRQDLMPGDVLTAEHIVKPNEAGFLPSVLGRDMRAVSISVGVAEGASGLIIPGDRGDVILIQNFGEPGTPLPQRSVSETILRNLRVIAVDQTISTEPKTKGNESRVAKTVTLEVTARQAEVLTVALQLGKLQLALRNAEDDGPGSRWIGEPTSTWGSDVSPALRDRGREPGGVQPSTTPGQPAPATGPASGVTVDVFHGQRIEQRCFDEEGRSSAACTPAQRPAVPAAEPVPKPAPGDTGSPPRPLPDRSL